MTHRHGPDEGWGVLMANSAIVCFSTLVTWNERNFWEIEASFLDLTTQLSAWNIGKYFLLFLL